MKKYDLLLKYLELKICALRENNLDAYDRLLKQTEDKDRDEEYHRLKGAYMGYDNAMEILSKVLDNFKEGKHDNSIKTNKRP